MLQYRQQDAAIYNSLLELSEADLALHRSGKDTLVDRLLAIIKKHGMREHVGVRLLHRHNDIALHEAMVEDHIVDSFGFALVTKAKAASSLISDYVPNSWILSDKYFVPIEFSHRTLISNPTINPMNNALLFGEMAGEIRSLGLSAVVGPSLLGSSFIDYHRPEGATMMIELTAQDDRANVLRFMVENHGDTRENGRAIETHWCLTVSGETNGDDKNVSTKTCTRICPYVQDPPVHQGTYIHQQPVI